MLQHLNNTVHNGLPIGCLNQIRWISKHFNPEFKKLRSQKVNIHFYSFLT